MAAVSVTEILTGTFLAPPGWAHGVQAVLLGHAIGGVLLLRGFDRRENGAGRDGDGVPFVRYGEAKQAALPVTQY